MPPSPHRPTSRSACCQEWNGASTANTSWRSGDRKSTRLNSSHLVISYAVFCLKKKKQKLRSISLIMLISTKQTHMYKFTRNYKFAKVTQLLPKVLTLNSVLTQSLLVLAFKRSI